jgi:hypothetical protein
MFISPLTQFSCGGQSCQAPPARSLLVAVWQLLGFMGARLFFRAGGSPNYDTRGFVSPSHRDPNVKIDDVKRFTALTILMLRPSIAFGVVARMPDTFAIETKSYSQ